MNAASIDTVLAEWAAILRKYGHGQADVLEELRSLAQGSEAEFVAALQSNSVWGGSGSVVDCWLDPQRVGVSTGESEVDGRRIAELTVVPAKFMEDNDVAVMRSTRLLHVLEHSLSQEPGSIQAYLLYGDGSFEPIPTKESEGE